MAKANVFLRLTFLDEGDMTEVTVYAWVSPEDEARLRGEVMHYLSKVEKVID